MVGIQETRIITRDRCNAGMQAARKSRWRVQLTEACTTERGYASARVAIACKLHFGMVAPQVEGWQYDRTRIAHVHIGAVCRGGVHCFSVYLATCEGISARNRALLVDLAWLIKSVRGPWVVMGDWNLQPETLEASGWVDEVEGKIICTRLPTCKRSVIDFFVVDRRLMHAVMYVKRMEGFGITPHYPVRMAMRMRPRKLVVRSLAAPQRVPASLPQGCLTKEQEELAREVAGVTGREEGHGQLQWEERVARWFEAVEEICAGIMGKEGRDKARMHGRTQGPRLVWKSALGPPGDQALQSTKVSRSWGEIFGWCCTIKSACVHKEAIDRRHPLARAAGVARRRILAARKWSWGDGEALESLHGFVDAFRSIDVWEDGGAVAALAGWAESESEKAARKASEDAAKKYRQWLQEGPAGGLSRQHAVSKNKGQWVPSKMTKDRMAQEEGITQAVKSWEGVEEGGGLERIVTTVQVREEGMEVPANIQQEVDMEAQRWEEIWTGGGSCRAMPMA